MLYRGAIVTTLYVNNYKNLHYLHFRVYNYYFRK